MFEVKQDLVRVWSSRVLPYVFKFRTLERKHFCLGTAGEIS